MEQLLQGNVQLRYIFKLIIYLVAMAQGNPTVLAIAEYPSGSP